MTVLAVARDRSECVEMAGKSGRVVTEGEAERRRQEVEKRFLVELSSALASMFEPDESRRTSKSRLSTPDGGVSNPREAVAGLKSKGTYATQVGVLSASWKAVGALELELNELVDREVLSNLSVLATDRKLAKSVAQFELCDRKLKEVVEPRLRAKLEEKLAAHRHDVMESNKSRTSGTQAALMSLLRRQTEFHQKASLNLRDAAAQLDS